MLCILVSNMTTLDQLIRALVAYRKRNGYTRTITLSRDGKQTIR